jgi:3D-(3,5/4)-trihydroxycyclohexane-1,2-dione acylhydrolase (decyclizing)
MVTAAARAHVNRLPVLFMPGDVYASRRPDPVLQQIEDFGDATVSANDSFRPVSRFFDRLTRPEQLLDSLPRTMTTLLDPANFRLSARLLRSPRVAHPQAATGGARY